MTTKLLPNPYEKLEITYPYCFNDNIFTNDEIASIITYCSDMKLESGVVVAPDGPAESERRKSDIKFVHPDDNNYWIFERLQQAIAHLNDRYYGFDLTGFDAFQYTEYNKEGSKYDYHMDTVMGNQKTPNLYATRKLSMIIPLVERSEYEGGDFQLLTGLPENPETVDQIKGRMIVFPSFMLHRVTPIISGVRKSLVVWCVGPKFK